MCPQLCNNVILRLVIKNILEAYSGFCSLFLCGCPYANLVNEGLPKDDKSNFIKTWCMIYLL